jgi:hypothetical protein
MAPDNSEVLYGTLGLMIVKTLEALGEGRKQLHKEEPQWHSTPNRSRWL